MASIKWKLRALLKKNFYEMKRNILSTLIEIFFPIIVVLLFYALKRIYDIENKEFSIQEGSIQNFTKMRSVYNLDRFDLLNISSYISNTSNISMMPQSIQDIANITPTIYGMSINPVLTICSSISFFDEDKKIRSIIATIGVPDEIKLKLINESLYFSKIINFSLNYQSFKDFKNEEEMDKYIKSKDYGESKDKPLICFGISFSQDKTNHKYNYSLHYFENKNYDGAMDVPNSLYLKDSFRTSPDLDSYTLYQYNGYSYIMKIIADYIYAQEINKETKINFGILPMKYNSYKTTIFGDIIGVVGPFFIIVAYASNLGIYVYRMVLEKETKVKEGMKIMGLTDNVYFLSYFIQYIIVSIIDSLIISLICLLLFTKFILLYFI